MPFGNKYTALREALQTTGTGQMKCFGQSMMPKISNGSLCEYRRQEAYKVGDIVFCKVGGRFIDAHLIVKIDGDRYQIANNHGYINGWTRQIYGRVIRATSVKGDVKEF